VNVLPRIKRKEFELPEGPILGMREFIQYPGETVFVPGTLDGFCLLRTATG